MVVESPSVGRSLKVLDFGLSKLVDRPLDATQQTIPGRVLGTPMYMAPEQWKSEPVDHRTDLYAASLILYEMLAGQLPFSGRDMTEAMVKTTSEAPPPLVEVRPSLDSEELEAIVQRGLAKQREERYQSAAEMLAELEEVDFGDLTPSSPRRTQMRRTTTRARRKAAPAKRGPSPALLVGGAVGLLAAAGLVWMLVGSGASGGGASALVSQLPDAERTAEQREYLDALQQAEKLLADGDPSAAIAAVDRAIAMPSSDAEGYVVRAQICRRRSELDTALADYGPRSRALPRLRRGCRRHRLRPPVAARPAEGREAGGRRLGGLR